MNWHQPVPAGEKVEEGGADQAGGGGGEDAPGRLDKQGVRFFEERVKHPTWMRKELVRAETTLTKQSKTMRMCTPLLSFLKMLAPAQRLMTNVTTVSGMFAKR